MYDDPNNKDKYYIYLFPQYIPKLENDARNFEILKPNNTVNLNKFLNMLISGYYEDFCKVDKYLTNAGSLKNTSSKKTKRKRIMIRPADDNRSLFKQISKRRPETLSDSEYFAQMIMSYCDLAMNKREQIIFHENYTILKKIIDSENKTRMSFTIRGLIHEIIPYTISVGKDEMFNYLLCSEILQDTKQSEMTFRINKLECITRVSGDNKIDEDVERHLKKMEQYGPQYIINEDKETCVRLTDKGVQYYKRINFGRPDRLSDKDENKSDGHYYHFDCSINQLFLYFRRFGCEAEIIYPEELRESINKFHKDALAIYDKEQE